AQRNLALARLAASLEAAITAGIPIIQAWELAAKASGSPYLKRILTATRPRMEQGETPAEILQTLKSFPELFVSSYTAGEVSGQLDSTLKRLHHYYQSEASAKLQDIAEWLPRLVYIAVAIGIAFQIIGFYSDYFGQAAKFME
ncbi:MAG: type II secretion system F family protein, partial [Verrucomicrobiota bacterium]|nr:type II secretion system F family protein [Verrucomicrobiota bacterium]